MPTCTLQTRPALSRRNASSKHITATNPLAAKKLSTSVAATLSSNLIDRPPSATPSAFSQLASPTSTASSRVPTPAAADRLSVTTSPYAPSPLAAKSMALPPAAGLKCGAGAGLGADDRKALRRQFRRSFSDRMQDQWVHALVRNACHGKDLSG